MIARVHRAIRAGFVTLCAITGLAACSADSGGTTNPGGDSVVVLASTGTTPNYTWSGPLAVSVNVARASAPSAAVWGISSPVNRDIASGARHGVVPSGASETVTAERVLASGIRYRVTVALVDGTSGSVDFTP